MELKKNYKFWFATGSQDLYGDECLSHVAKHAQIIVHVLPHGLNIHNDLCMFKPCGKTCTMICAEFQ